MTKQVLVLDGNEVKMRLQADRAKFSHRVHVDWLRFTVIRKNAPVPHEDVLFPSAESCVPAGFAHLYDLDVIHERRARVIKLLRELPDPGAGRDSQ